MKAPTPESSSSESQIDRRYWPEPIVGLIIGGMVVPSLLFIYCLMVLRDVGGYLFWPVIALGLGCVGFTLGFALNLFRHRRNQRR
jgi:uncharacterized RDD family membrane protein YckC